MNFIDNLKFLLVQTKYNVYSLVQIKQIAPYLYDWIDLALETETQIFCFKDIWTKDNLTQETLNNYIYYSEQINSKIISSSGKIHIFVLIVKNFKPDFDNSIYNKKNIHIINKFNKNKLIKEIIYFLYSCNIFLYEPDNSVIMLD